MRLSPFVLALAALLIAGAPHKGAAHPHIFIDTGLEIILDTDGSLKAIEVTWGYDDFYTLLTLEDMAMDPDGDGALTEAELAQVQGFDMTWVPEFEGDLYVTRDGAPVALGPPVPVATVLVDGRLYSRHRRALKGNAEGLVIKAYDPTFYTAYTLDLGITIAGADCSVGIMPADLNSAYAALEELLFARPQADVESNFPEVGEQFADTVTLTCSE